MILARYIYSYSCINIMIGLKFIPLRTPGGESTSQIGVFVKIEIKALKHKQASSSGKCLQDLDSSIRKFSLPETCQYSESYEDIVAVDHVKKNGNQKFTHLLSNNSADGGHDLLRGQQLVRQGAINEFTVEIHNENNQQEL